MNVPNEWQGLLMGTFHSSPNGLQTSILDFKAPNPKMATIYYRHPHLGHLGTKPRQMSVHAYPPDVFQWLIQYRHVSVPSILKWKLEVNDLNTQDALRFLVDAELKSTFQQQEGKWRAIAMKVWRIEPWYFIELERMEEESSANFFSKRITKTYKTNIEIVKADALTPLADPEKFGDLDHDLIFKQLLDLRADILAGLWILRPEYFDILKYIDADRWQVLFERAKKGMLDGKTRDRSV